MRTHSIVSNAPGKGPITAVVIDIDYGWRDILKSVMNTKKPIWAEVGIFNGVTPATVGKGDGTKRDGTLIAEYATYLEYGTRFIAPYRWMRSVLENKFAEYNRIVAERVELYLSGKLSASKALLPICTNIQRDFRKSITEKGLIDTGAMRMAVQYRMSTDATRRAGSE